MNGLYILFPIETMHVEKNMNTNILKFNPYIGNNTNIIQDFAKLEYRLIEYYKNTYQCRCKISNFLAKQMYSGNMKLYKESTSMDIGKKNMQYIIKISGVWETYEDIGLTYKLIEVNENYLE
jgi:hypothetical protein